MSTQIDLLSESPIARNSDPETSHQAADELTTRASQQRKCLEFVSRNPGLTSAELAVAFRVDRYMTARRLPELRGATEPLVRNGRARRCVVTHRKALTWYPA